MRAILNAILTVISAASLTDDEFSALTIESAPFDINTYNALLAVLDAREVTSTTRDRLRYFFLAKGVEVEESSAGKSNIFLGTGLCS